MSAPPRLHALLLTTALLSGPAAGQGTLVVPPRVATQEANNSTSWPFGIAVPSRMQGVYGSALFPAASLQLRSLGFRPEGNQAASAKSGVELELFLSTTASSPWQPSPELAKNRGPDHRLVVKRRKLDLPATSALAAPQAFTIAVPLDQAFVFDPAKGGLLVEIAIWTIPAGSHDLDLAYTECPRLVMLGKGCGGPTVTVTGGLAVPKGTTTHCGAQDTEPYIGFAIRGGPSFGVLLQAFAKAPSAVPVPLPLGGCALHVAPELLLAGRLDASGAADLRLPLTLDLGLAAYATQCLTIDLGFRTLASTEALYGRLGGWEAQGRVFAIGKADATQGSVQPGASWVLQLAP